jgi:hypothetical protein
MRTTISIPDERYSEATEVMGSRPFSEFASEAIRNRVRPHGASCNGSAVSPPNG